MVDELKQQYTLRITQANRTELVVILYEMLLEYMKEAKSACEKNEYKEFHIAINRGKTCVNELIQTLDFTYELSYQLRQLYLYVNQELIKADVRQTTESFQGIEVVIGGLKESFSELCQKDTSGPVMKNTQSVYVGLTYGKTQLQESMKGSDNRGYRI